jgi:AcrR family transcriptional regulator
MPKVSAAHRQARRRQILDAAVACFAREGFHRTTMHDIVREAQLSPGAIYGYFAGKDAIIDAIGADRHALETALIAAAATPGDLPQVLRRLAREFFAILGDPAERRRRRVAVQIWAEALRNPRLLRQVRGGVDRPRALFADLIRAGQTRGDVAPTVAPDAVARVMIALFQGFILQQAWDPRVAVPPYLSAIEAVIDGLTTGTGRHPARPRKRVKK